MIKEEIINKIESQEIPFMIEKTNYENLGVLIIAIVAILTIITLSVLIIKGNQKRNLEREKNLEVEITKDCSNIIFEFNSKDAILISNNTLISIEHGWEFLRLDLNNDKNCIFVNEELRSSFYIYEISLNKYTILKGKIKDFSRLNK